MSEEIEDNTPSAPAHPALKNFNSTWEYVLHVAKETAMTALKGAVALGLAGAVIGLFPALVTSIPIVSSLATAVFGSSFSMAGFAMGGAWIGAAAGAAIGLAKGFSGAEDAVEDKEQMLISKHNRAGQLAANQQMMQMNMARMQGAAQPMSMDQGFSPQNQMLPNMGAGQGAAKGWVQG